MPRRTFAAFAGHAGIAVAKARATYQSLDDELLQRSESLKSAVLDALAHEIKGPLSTVKIAVSTLSSAQPGSAAQQRELLEIVNEELGRIERSIDETIRVSNRKAAELRLNEAPHRIGDVVARALQGLGPQIDGRVVEVQIPEPLPCGRFDSQLVEKVIRQLVDNASKYSSPSSPIRIWAEFTGEELMLHVADSGCGISKEDQSRIFEKHYRGRARVSGTPGSGLGLASAKTIMEAHGGEIWVNSAPGSGSVFHISLPVMENSLEQCKSL